MSNAELIKLNFFITDRYKEGDRITPPGLILNKPNKDVIDSWKIARTAWDNYVVKLSALAYLNSSRTLKKNELGNA